MAKRLSIIYVGGRSANDSVSWKREDWDKLDAAFDSIPSLFHEPEAGRFRRPLLGRLASGPFYVSAPTGEFFRGEEILLITAFFKGVAAAHKIRAMTPNESREAAAADADRIAEKRLTGGVN